MDNDKLIIRRATIGDIDFIVDTIAAAEKSGTDNFGLAKLFDVTEEEMRGYIKEMLEEEVDGCELSISSFIVAEYDEEPVAAFGGWIEVRNEDNMPSALLKANLINYYLPKEKIMASMAKSDLVQPLQIDREEGTYQLEYSYTKPEYRGLGIMNKIINRHISEYQQVIRKKKGGVKYRYTYLKTTHKQFTHTRDVDFQFLKDMNPMTCVC